MNKVKNIVLSILLVLICTSCGLNTTNNPHMSKNLVDTPLDNNISNITESKNTLDKDTNTSKSNSNNTRSDNESSSTANHPNNNDSSNDNKEESQNKTEASKDNNESENKQDDETTESKDNTQYDEEANSKDKTKVWVVDKPAQIIKETPIEYSSPDKSIFTQSYCDANHIIHLRTLEGNLELWQITEEKELLIGVDVVMGDVGRVTLISGETIWLWGGYTAAYHYAETLDNYASFGNNGIMPGNYNCIDMVQKWTPVTVIPEEGHWEWE